MLYELIIGKWHKKGTILWILLFKNKLSTSYDFFFVRLGITWLKIIHVESKVGNRCYEHAIPFLYSFEFIWGLCIIHENVQCNPCSFPSSGWYFLTYLHSRSISLVWTSLEGSTKLLYYIVIIPSLSRHW